MIEYGLGADWAKMWEETQLIRRMVKSLKYDDTSYLKKIIDDAIYLLEQTEQHIIQLSKQYA